jgi:hypothetical protein
MAQVDNVIQAYKDVLSPMRGHLVERVPTLVTMDAEGMVKMDGRYWMEYARLANIYRQCLLAIEGLPPERLDEVALMVEKALKE